MGVYIDGMGMPKSCYYCPMTNDGFYLCKATSPFKELEDDCEECKPQWCPLIPVPEHGDLIDRDAMIDDIKKAVAPTEYIKNRNSNMIYFLQHQETIIPAEEGEI